MSKPIGKLTLKATPVGTDMVAIADSEDSDKTKKVLLSALSGGANNVHLVENVTESSGVYSGTASDVTQYENGHLYIFRTPNAYVTNTTRYININSLGNKEFDFNYSSNFADSVAPGDSLPGGEYTTIVVYNSSTNKFYLVCNTRSANYYNMWCSNLHAVRLNVGQGSSAYTTVEQFVKEVSGADVTIKYSTPYNNKHSIHICTTALTSLTITNLNSTSLPVWEKEIHFTTSSTFTFTATDLVGKWLGVAAPTFEPNTSYVISIKNGYAVYSKVGA